MYQLKQIVWVKPKSQRGLVINRLGEFEYEIRLADGSVHDYFQWELSPTEDRDLTANRQFLQTLAFYHRPTVNTFRTRPV